MLCWLKGALPGTFFARRSHSSSKEQKKRLAPYDKQRIRVALRQYCPHQFPEWSWPLPMCFDCTCRWPSYQQALAGQHKFWKYVSPIRTYFAWLPEQLSRTHCRAALERRSGLPYGAGTGVRFQAFHGFRKHLSYWGYQKCPRTGGLSTHAPRKAEVVLWIQCTDNLHPNGPRQRRKLFTAALKLLRFAIGIETVCCENEEQRALHAALLPLLQLEDGHVLATLSAIVLALCEGRTGLAISGVFGAGKTRSAAALLAGLLVFDPSLQLMVLTKENIAAHAVAEHLVSLQMPDHIQGKMGRLVGYYEQNRKGSYTPLDIFPSNRNQVIRQKSLLIGCGGGFQQECSQQFSPVADWMSSVDLFLEDEGQQYGNMEEAASVARTPATCLEVWSGDHRQTPGGLKKSKESKSFRKKLTKRPLALRCQTQYTQAHDLGGIAMRYLDCPEGSFPWKIRQLLEDDSTAIDPAVVQTWHDLIGDSPPCLSREIQRAAFAILWMGLRGEREKDFLACLPPLSLKRQESLVAMWQGMEACSSAAFKEADFGYCNYHCMSSHSCTSCNLRRDDSLGLQTPNYWPWSGSPCHFDCAEPPSLIWHHEKEVNWNCS